MIDPSATAADVSMMEEEDEREAEMIQLQQQAVEGGERFQYRGTPERERKVTFLNISFTEFRFIIIIGHVILAHSCCALQCKRQTRNLT